MGKKILIPCIVFCILLTMVVFTQAADKKAKPQSKPTTLISKAKSSKIIPFDKQSRVMQPEVIYSTDFETDGEWQAIQLGTTGHIFEWVTDNYHSATHSWHVPDDSATTEADAVGIETAIISPEITLPAEIGGSATKVLEMSYWFDVETPNTAEADPGTGVMDVWQLEIFTPYEGDNFWHTDATEAFEGNSWWCGDPSLGTYGPNWRQELWTPVLDLSGATGTVNLTFKNAPNSEPGYDYCNVEISDDGGTTWDRLARYDEEHDPVQYFDASFDISAYATSTVIVRWRFTSDGATESNHSWHIDNVQIADDATTFLYDDGGDTATELIPQEHPYSWVRLHYDYADEASGHNPPGWTLEDRTTIYNGTLSLLEWAGQTVRFRIRVSTDGWNQLGLASGYGFYFDDLEIIGMGIAPYDVATLGASGFQNAVVGKKLNLGVVVTNVGSNDITGTLQWTGEILSIMGEDTTVVWPAMFGRLDVTDFGRDSVVVIPTVAAREWLVENPGDYLFRGSVSYAQDGDATNNSFAVDFTVFGPPMMNVVYRDNFEDAGKTSLEDLGFTVENGGGCDATGLNVNKWEYDAGLIFGQGGALLSWAWGVLDPGSDEVAPWDSSEVLDEGLITPEIDISGLGKHATLFMNYYVYFRPSYPGYPPFGEQWTYFDIDFTIDGGQTWYNAFHWADDDSLVPDYNRLPNSYYGYDNQISYLSYLGVDLTQAVVMGGEKLHVRFKVLSDNSYFVAASIEDITIYSGVDHARIMSVEDIPEDQGKQVRVTWKASFNDLTLWTEGMYGEFEEHIVTHYNLWRQIPAGASMNAVMVPDMKTMLSKPGKPGDSYILGDMQFDFIATIPAHQDLMYNYVAPTLWDDVETFFMVSAHTEDPMVFVDSDLMSGTSIDNLAPEAPMNLMAMGQNNTNVLTWEVSPAEDVKYYSIYRTETSGSYPAEPLTFSTDLTYTDEDVEIGKNYFYVVTATDFGLNEGETSNEASVLTGVEDNKSNVIPTEFALEQNYPNPFNPATYINYQLPTNAHVTISIFNTTGQEIKTLVSKEMNAGYHTTVWDGTNNAGEKVSSGLYLYKIKTGSFTDIKKMMLLR